MSRTVLHGACAAAHMPVAVRRLVLASCRRRRFVADPYLAIGQAELPTLPVEEEEGSDEGHHA